MKHRILTTLLACCALVTPAKAELTLTSKDGTFVLSGTLEKFEEGHYLIETSLGILSVESDLVDCSGETCPSLDPMTQALRIAVSENLNPLLMPDMLRAFYQASEMNVQIASTGQGALLATVAALDGNVLAESKLVAVNEEEAFELLRKDEVDVIFTTRRASEDEVDAVWEEGRPSLLTPESEKIYGADAVVVSVSPDNPLRALRIDQISKLFSGEIKNWSELGGADVPVTVYAPADGLPVTDTFREVVLYPNLSDFSPDARRNLSDTGVQFALASDPGAIGIVRMSTLRKSKQLSLVGSCGIRTDANRFSLLTENFPLNQRLYSYTNGKEKGKADMLLEFAEGQVGQRLMSQHGYVGISPEVFQLDQMGRQFAYSLANPENQIEENNLRTFSKEVVEAQRLSITFRFSKGSSQLDNRARADIGRLIDLLKKPAYQGSEVLLVGFTDSVGKSDLNRVLSKRRADQVLKEIELQLGSSDGIERFSALGFGESFPVSCNDEETGRYLNRRVDVWLR